METVSQILLALAVAFAILWSFRTKKMIPIIINIGMSIGVLLAIIPFLQLTTIGMYMYMAFLVLAFFHGLADIRRSLIDRLVICLMSAGIFLYWLWAMNHWPGNTMLAAVFVLLVGLAGVITRAKLRDELGFLVIIAADATAILLSI